MRDLPRSELYGQVRLGRVSSVDKSRHSAQVQFEEIDGFVSYDLQVLVTRPGDYSLPAKDTPVLCLLLDGRLGAGFILGAIYTDNDAAPLNDDGQRAVASDDLRLGAPDASDKVALAPKCKDNFDKLKQHFQVLEQIITGPPINEAGNGAPSSFQAALAAAIAGSAYPDPQDPAAEKVKAK